MHMTNSFKVELNVKQPLKLLSEHFLKMDDANKIFSLTSYFLALGVCLHGCVLL